MLNKLPSEVKENTSFSIDSSSPFPASNTPRERKLQRYNTENAKYLSPRNMPSSSISKSLKFNTKSSVKENGVVKGYAAATDQGISRNYNEDRVSIILNISKPSMRKNADLLNSSFFGVYDGHGGSKCADFLREHLHQFIINDESFPENPTQAILNGFRQAELQFLKIAYDMEPKNRSGSCAIISLIVGNTCYVANLGDSRGILSVGKGKKLLVLSKDHKPNEESEKKRILENGGSVFMNNLSSVNGENISGPYRVYPGRLSVSRTIGDLFVKIPELGGNPRVVIAVPEIKIFTVQPEHDFLLLASDGIFDKLSNREILSMCWSRSSLDDNDKTSELVNSLLSLAISRKSLDNLTAVVIAFSNYFNV